MPQKTENSVTFLNKNPMNVPGAALCICFSLSVSLHAQESADSILPHRMSFEKADSLLISLSKGKSKKTGFTEAVPTQEPDTVTLEEDAVTADTALVAAPPTGKRQKAKITGSQLLTGQEAGRLRLGNEEEELHSINEGTIFGAGGYKMKDDYLSPEKYGGAGFRFMNERMRLTGLAGSKISRQNIVNVDISSTINGAENANFLSAFVDYSLGYHYRFLPDPYFKIMIGGSARGLLGMVYNTRNGNNPMTLHADLDLNFSLIAIHEFRVKTHALAIRYQFETPFAGLLFCPVYSQSYYEIFTLGNTAEVFNFASFRNKFAVRNYLTLDFPVGRTTFRVGYSGFYYATDVHEIDRYIISHNVMIGFVKEFVAFGGRDIKRNLFHSAYY
jgi:hypothetical protein